MSTTSTGSEAPGGFAGDCARVVARLGRCHGRDGDHRLQLSGDELDGVDPRAVRTLALAERRLEDQRDRAPPGPSGTKTIQDDYSAEMYKRFRRIKGLIRATVVDNDAFRLRDSPTAPTEVAEADDRLEARQADPFRDFPFPRDDEKIEAFLEWLQEAEDDEILEVTRRPGSTDIASRSDWQDIYVRRAYGKGIEWANARLREQGIDIPEEDIAQVFARPMHAEPLGILYTRNFQELQGITRAMDQAISRRLAEGFSQGWNPRKMARAINSEVDDIGLTRARTLARTETINAHAESTLNRYEEMLGSDAQVTGKAEWRTAGDSRVCPICQGLEGSVLKLDQARGMIPLHPNCRCTWLPVVDESRLPTGNLDAVAERVVDAARGVAG